MRNLRLRSNEASRPAPPQDRQRYFQDTLSGTWGPENAQALLAQRDGWPLPTELVDQTKSKTNAKSKLPA